MVGEEYLTHHTSGNDVDIIILLLPYLCKWLLVGNIHYIIEYLFWYLENTKHLLPLLLYCVVYDEMMRK